ncbi:hypothetical protein [Chryseobacterium indoltheticum]|uniref:hypothetical protein n=1 Tax=Chryseobacterium indoltheticum TaxID=254 RepID=UPI003F49A4CF
MKNKYQIGIIIDFHYCGMHKIYIMKSDTIKTIAKYGLGAMLITAGTSPAHLHICKKRISGAGSELGSAWKKMAYTKVLFIQELLCIVRLLLGTRHYCDS